MDKTQNQQCPQCSVQNPPEADKCYRCNWSLTTAELEVTLCPDDNLHQVLNETQTFDDTLVASPAESLTELDVLNLTGDLARFDIVDIIGQGGIGAVYRAKDQVLERDVALKMLRVADPKHANVLLAEARLACKLHHPNIVTVFEVVRANDSHCIVMEWVDGQPLDELIPLEGMALEQALQYACQIADGLVCAHQHYIIHHDIKPQNLMLTVQGQIKILDFGIAGLLQHQNASADGNNQMTGSPHYMAPEQVLGLTLDQRSDIFSFGIVLYQMLTGQRPFQGNNITELSQAITSGDVIPIVKHLPKLPPAVVELVAKMLATDKADRWQSADELSAAVQVIYRDLTYEKNWWQRRHRLSKAAMLLPFLLLLGWSSKEVLFPPSTSELIERQLLDATKIALLPFDNISGDPLLQLFGDGLAVALSSDLAAVGRVRGNSWIIPSSEIARMKDPSVQKISNKYGADLVLTGSVQHMGSTRQLVLNLLNGKDGRQLKTVELSIDANKLFQGHRDIRQQALALLDWTVPAALSAKFNAQRPQFDGAYKDYLEGQGYLYRYEQPGNVIKAQQAFSRAIAIDGSYESAYVGLAEAQLQHFRKAKDRQWLDKMAVVIETLKDLNPNNTMLDYLSAEVLARKGQYRQAQGLFESSIKNSPKHIKSYVGLAKAHNELGELAQAEAIHLDAIAMAPNSTLAVVYLGIFCFRHGQYNQAIKQFEQLALMAPNNHYAFGNIAAAYYSLGKIELAIKNTRKALKINPTANGYSNLATMFFYQQDYAKAVDAYHKAIEYNPSSFVIWGNLADAWRLLENPKSNGAYQKAADLALAALELNPNDSWATATLAYYLASAGHGEQALNHLKNMAKNSTGNEHFKMALTYDILGDVELVLQHLAYALEKNYSAQEVRDTPLLIKVRQDKRFDVLLKEWLQAGGTQPE
ncbi:MAG: serine/threonine protein kinase/tetratricopeptide (TPR) repeat protein [Phenylobacterium sp.]|jgi:serine/threonine protein kinase/tetratricopeptide (TPR) repeat protein